MTTAANDVRGPICQSCGMPLMKPEDFGTARGGARAPDYCRFCYVDGAFANPGMTMAEMADFCVGVLERQGMAREQARALMTGTLPQLKRWRSPVDGAVTPVRA